MSIRSGRSARAALPFVTLPFAALVLAVAPVGAGAQAHADSRAVARAAIDTTLAFARGGTVDVGALGANVIVTAWSRQEVRVRAHVARGRFETSLSAERVAIRVEPDGDRRTGRTGSIGDARIELTVPEGTRVRAISTSGDLTITGTRGEVEAAANSGTVMVRATRGLVTLKSLSGDLTALELDGDVVAHSSSGDVVLRDVRGEVRATTVSGDLALIDVRGRGVTARTTSGDVVVRGVPDANARYELTTHSGDAVLMLPDETRADLIVQTYSGAFDTSFPVVLTGGVGATRPRTFEFSIGGDGADRARIRVETFSGDVVLQRRAERDRVPGEREPRAR